MDHEQTSEPWYPIPPDQDEQENPGHPDPPDDDDGDPSLMDAYFADVRAHAEAMLRRRA